VFAASLAPFYATSQGRALGTSRAIAAVIASITGKRATVIGKPALFALRFAATQIGIKSSAQAVVGDDPELEVPMAHSGRSLAVAVHSGVGDATAFAAMPRATRAHLVVHDIAELARLYAADAGAGAKPRALSAAKSRR
jgi:NagD protein